MSGRDPLFGSLAAAVGAEARAPELPANQWPAMLALAERHRVSALLAAAYEGADLPADIAMTLVQRRLHSRGLARRNSVAQAELAAALGRSGIAFLSLKGASVAHRFYHPPDDRHSIDIDLLVAEGDLACALTVIRNLGYAPIGGTIDDGPSSEFLGAAADIELIRKRDSTKVELHWRLSRNRYLPDWPFDDLVQHAVMLPTFGAPLPVLSLSASLFYLTCHGARHLWFRLKWLADIDRMLRAMPAPEQQKAARLAQEKGCARLFGTSLVLAHEVFGSPLDAVGSIESNSALLGAMRRALHDPVAVRPRYGLRDMPAALSNAYGRYLLRPSRDYRRELVRGTFFDAEDLDSARTIPGAALAKLSRKLRLAR